MFLIEVISLLVRPVTLAVRLMVNMAAAICCSAFLSSSPCSCPSRWNDCSVPGSCCFRPWFSRCSTASTSLATEHELSRWHQLTLASISSEPALLPIPQKRVMGTETE